MLSKQNQPPPASVRAGPQVATPAGGTRTNNLFKALGMRGLLLMLAGLAICGSFFLPWFASSLVCNDSVCHPPAMKDTHFLSLTLYILGKEAGMNPS